MAKTKAAGHGQEHTKEQANDFVNALGRTLREANRYLTEQLRAAHLEDLSTSHGDILAQLFAHEPLTMQDLAISINRDPSTITALVKKLAAGGYVQTAKDPSDGRAVQVTLTEKGRGLQPRFEEISDKLVTVQMKDIDSADLEAARRVLKRVESNFADALDA